MPNFRGRLRVPAPSPSGSGGIARSPSAGLGRNRHRPLRFYALRLHEAGMIKSSPQKLIEQGTDWRFFNELKKELKG
jgi:hypothetical protein